MLEIRWHGRGGQGVKTAATLLAAVAIHEGKYSQGFPEYGPERGGAPVAGYTRIDDKPITIHSDIEAPDVVAVVDATLLDVVPVAEGLKEQGVILVNTSLSPAEIRNKLAIPTGKVYTIDATQISLDCLGKNIPNTPMMGAIARITKVLKLDTLLDDVKEKFGKKFKPEIVEGNINAVKRGYEEVKGE